MLALARKNLNPQVRGEYCSFGFVSAVIEGANGKYYTGVNVDLACGLGFCAERNAASTMLTDGETAVRRVVCVDRDGKLMPPCGCCREFLAQLSPENANTEFLLERIRSARRRFPSCARIRGTGKRRDHAGKQRTAAFKTCEKRTVGGCRGSGCRRLVFCGVFTYYLTLDDGLRSLLWVKKTADEQYYQAIDDDAFWQAAIDGAVSSLDKYSAYYTDVEYDQQTDADKGILAGMGASFFAGSNKISKVAIGSPLFFAQSDADFAGGWVTGIARAEGEMQNTFTLTALSAQMKGLGAGDTVSVRISSEGAEDTDAATCSVVQVTFAQYHESYVLYAVKGRAYAVLYGEDGEGVWTDVSAYTSLDERVPEGRAYLRLVQFNGGAAEEFAAAAEQYKADGVSALLFDLRNE